MVIAVYVPQLKVTSIGCAVATWTKSNPKNGLAYNKGSSKYDLTFTARLLATLSNHSFQTHTE